MPKPKIKVVRQIYLDGELYSKPETAARRYVAIQCHDWWQAYLEKNKHPPQLGTRGRFWTTGGSTGHIDIAILHERKVRMYKRVLPIFKKMLQ